MLLSKLSTESGDLVLQRCNHVVVFLLRTCHASFHLTDILPDVNLATHDLTYTATTTSMTRHAPRL
jgi:hypothetical protein